MGFRHRLIAFFVVALVAVQAVTALIAFAVLRANAIAEGKRELAASTEVFTRQLDALSERVADEVNILSLDYALRQAIGNGDHGTVLSALRNHGRRVGARRMMLIDLDGRIAGDTAEPDRAGGRFALQSVIARAADAEKATALATLDGGVYWIVAVPVKAPVPIAFIVACLPVDDALLERLRTLSLFPNAVAIARLDPAAGWVRAASTGGYQPALHGKTAPVADTEIVQQKGGPALTWTGALKTAPESEPIVAVLDYPLHNALQTFREVMASMIAVLVAALGVGLGGVLLIARGVSRPIETLAATARRIAQGDYAPVEPIQGAGEIGALSADLGNMAQAIAEREAELKRTVGEVAVARDEAVRANEAKSQFLANMSHELRTPLNAILGFSDMITSEVFGPLGSERYALYIRDIHTSGKHLLGLVEEMLDLSCVEAGTLQIEHELLSISDALADSLTMLEGAADIAGVALTVHGARDNWPSLTGDKRKLTQAVSNLIHNAIKFTPAGGRVDIDGRIDDGYFSLSVSDTGIGMREEDIPIVTQPFQRLASAFDGRYQGAGLGLPFAKAVVEHHGGSLRIASALGRGTTVTIELPLDDGIAIMGAA